MTTLTKQDEPAKFTVFAGDGFQHNEDEQDEFAGVGLGELIALYHARWPHSRLMAWAPAWPGGPMRKLRDESIAAGRVIDFIDGKYVPRGVPAVNGGGSSCIHGNEAFSLESVAAAVDAAMIARTSEPKRAPLDWAKSVPFDNFPGFAVVRDCESQPISSGRSIQAFRSPDLA